MKAPLLLLQVLDSIRADTASSAEALREVVPAGGAADPGVLEWVRVLATVASAIVAAVAAFFAARAARTSARAAQGADAFNRQQASWKRAEKERTYYDAILVTPALDALRHYRREMGKALRESAEPVHDAVARDAPVSEHRAAVDAVLDERFTGLRDKLRDVLLEAARDWNDGDLLDRMQAELQRLEDEVTAEVMKLLTPGAEINFEAVVNNVAGDIVRLVMEFDPALRAMQDEGQQG